MSDVTIRCLTLFDMPNAAAVHRMSFDERLPWLAGLHTPDEDVEFWTAQLFQSCRLFGAERDGDLLGVIAISEGWVEQLYVLPEMQVQGIGTSLLTQAKAAHDQLLLWTFRRNTLARRFYEARGFVAIKETDGSGNEEREPDILYRWAQES